jgi:hypothetical protein
MAKVTLSSLPPTHSALLRSLGVRTSDDGAAWEVTLDERRFVFHWLIATKSEPSGFRVETLAGPVASPPRAEDAGFDTGGYRAEPWAIAPNPGPLLARFETKRDRFGKRIGLNRETQLGDAEFDERIYLECDAPDATSRKLFQSEASRRELVRVLSLGAPAVNLDRNGLLSICLRWVPKDIPSQAQFEALLRAFGAFAESLPALRGRVPQLKSKLAVVLVLGSLIGSILGIPALFLVRWLWRPVDDDLYSTTLLIGIFAWIVLVPLSFFAIRGRSTALRDWIMTVSFSSFGVPIGCMTLAMAINGAFDTSAPVEHTEWVARRWTTSGKSTTYHVQLEPTVPGDRGFSLTVSSSTYHALAGGTAARVTTRDGALGWAWLVSVGPAN